MDGLKFLCLHGYGTSADFMKTQMETWLQKLPNTKFVFFDGAGPISSLLTRDPALMRFHGEKSVFDNFSSYKMDEIYTRDYMVPGKLSHQADIDRLVAFISENGGFDGMICFS